MPFRSRAITRDSAAIPAITTPRPSSGFIPIYPDLIPIYPDW